MSAGRAAGRVHDRLEDARASLDEILDCEPDSVREKLEAAVGAVVRARDELIGERREANAGRADELSRLNGVLSVLLADEYPLGPFRWDLLRKARDALADLTDGEEQQA